MTEDQKELLDASRESLSAARLLWDGGYYGFAAARAYYTMFYVAEAFLEGEEMAFSKHAAVIAAFGRHFVHAGKVPAEFQKHLTEAQELRLYGDYGSVNSVSPEKSRESIERAQQFIEVAERLIGHLPSSGNPGA